MNRSLKTLALSREAGREAAIAGLAAARREFDLARAACEQAHAAVVQSMQWRAEVLTRCALGSNQALRESVLPACEALLRQRQQQFAQTQIGLHAAQVHVTARRQDLMARERDSLRLQEWQQMEKTQRRRELAVQENHRDDEHVPTRQLRIGTVGGAGTP